MRLVKQCNGSVWRCTGNIRSNLREPLSHITRPMIASVYADSTRRSISVCFTGHRHISAATQPLLVQRLDELLEELYQRGYRDFLSGGALGFDLLAAERVLQLQSLHSGVRLIMVLPCGDQTARWHESDCRRYERILYVADETRVLSPTYYEGCMQVRNRHMVDHSALCVCYMHLTHGGTASTVAYALKQELPIINVAMDLPSPTLRELECLESDYFA